jgi:DNA helicase-2/ATP-dependent DNA helicase PcrA
MAVAKEFEAIADEPDLSSFLTRISLVSDLDSANLDQDAVKMMTLHLAKGLEFPIVFLTGLEDGLFPHFRSLESPTAMEEERRLLYVGITRAADLLYMTFARKRMLLGRKPGAGGSFSANYAIPSRFLKEIKPGLLTGYYQQTDVAASNDNDPRFTDDRANSIQSSRWDSRSDSNFQNTTTPSSRFARPGFRNANSSTSHTPSSGSSGSFNRSNEFNSNMSARPIQTSGTKSGEGNLEPFEHLKVGDTVQHSKFGIGEVTQVIGDKDKELYNVDFKTSGKRLLDPRFAKLIKLS